MITSFYLHSLIVFPRILLEESIRSLMGLGFDRDAAVTALIASGNNVDVAANRLLGNLGTSQSDFVQPNRLPGGSSCSEDSQYLRSRGGPPSW